MDTQELNDELGVPGAQALLRSSPLCRLAYLGQDGLPRVIPIGFYRNGKRIVVCTATTSPKVRALESRPDVALTIDEGSESGNARSLQIRGRATLETIDGIPDEYIEAASKSLDAEQRAEFESKSAPCMARWCASPSRRAGRASTTSVPAGRRDSSPSSSAAADFDEPGSRASAREDHSQREHRVGSGRFERPPAP